MKVITKTNRQINEYNLYLKRRECWMISKRYSDLLYKNINKNNYEQIANDIYKNYLNEIKPGKNIKRENYVLIWDTMINTINNNKYNIDKKRNSIRQLNYINKIK